MATIRSWIILLAAPFSGVLAGCQPVWTKPNEGPNDFAAIVADCQAQNRWGIYGSGIPAIQNAQAALDRCIAAAGYIQVMPRDLQADARGHDVVGPVGVPTTELLHDIRR
ncbi:MAG: hypothetical protein WCI94_16035 [Rhodospirillales bacterium]